MNDLIAKCSVENARAKLKRQLIISGVDITLSSGFVEVKRVKLSGPKRAPPESEPQRSKLFSFMNHSTMNPRLYDSSMTISDFLGVIQRKVIFGEVFPLPD